MKPAAEPYRREPRRSKGGWARAALAACSLAGCMPPPPSPPVTQTKLEVRDDHGVVIRLAGPAQRIVCLAPAHTETLYAIGAGEAIIAADKFSTDPPQAAAKARLNCWPRPPLEQIVAQRPDLVLVLAEEGPALKPLRDAGLPVAKLFPKTLDQVFRTIVTLGRLTGRDAAAAALCDGMRRRLQAVRDRLEGVPRRSFAYELDGMDPGRPFVAGGAGIYSELMAAAGGVNVFADVRMPAAQVSAEQVVARKPEVLFLGDTQSPVNPQSPELVRRRPGWSAIPAVAESRIYAVDSTLLTRPGPRLVDGVELVAHRLHPERFR